MPADDLVLNVRQIENYTAVPTALPTDALLIQRGGLGGPYQSIAAQAFVSTALAAGGVLGVGVMPPGNAAPGMLFTVDLAVGYDRGIYWNAYPATGGVRYLTSGNAGALGFDPVLGWEFSFVPPGSAGAVVPAWQRLVRITTDGELMVEMGSVLLARDPVAPLEAATAQWVSALVAATVTSFNGRSGDVFLMLNDVVGAGGAPIFSPRFTGTPMAETPPSSSSSSRLATTAFVHRGIVEYLDHFTADHPFVFTFNGRTGDIVLTEQDILDAGGSDVWDSPTLTGIPTAPTAEPGTNTQQIATTAFVEAAITSSTIFAPLVSPSFSGQPTGPTAAPGSATGQLATTAFVMNAVAAATAGVASFNGRTGLVTLAAADIEEAGGALLVSPVFTGTPTGPTAAPGDNSSKLATTAFVDAAVSDSTAGVVSFNSRTGAVILASADLSAAGGALLASPAFTGAPTAPTASPGTSSTVLATTAFVQAALATSGGVGSFNGRTGAVVLTSNDISAAGGAALASPAFTGAPTAPTPIIGTNSTAIATTAFVQAALASAGVSSFNTRTGAVTLTLADVTGVGGAPLQSPAFSGTPTASTAAPGTSSGQLATTAFVQAALAGGAGVSSFNTRTGPVVLTTADITGAGGAALASPGFSGTPTAPTAAPGNSTQQLATTAFVQAALATGSVVSFNGRVGAVTLLAADISAAGGAVLASPAFTGAPTAPTAVPGTNSGQLATTAYVQAALGTLGGVTSFNGRAGIITLTAPDLTSAGGALLASPAFTGNPTAPQPALHDSDASVPTTAWVQTELAGRQNRNRLINAHFVVSLGYPLPLTPAASSYVINRWTIGLTQASHLTVGIGSRYGLQNAIGLSVASAATVGAGDSFNFSQSVEQANVMDFWFGTANAQPVTLSFQVMSTLAGLFSGSLRSPSGTGARSYPFTYTIAAANTWQYVSITIPGDTFASAAWTPANNSATGLLVVFDLGSGATFRGPAGAWASGTLTGANGAVSLVATAGAVLYLTEVQLEKGSIATPFDWMTTAAVFQLCQRYFQVSEVQSLYTSSGVGNVATRIALATLMRASPTLIPVWTSQVGGTGSLVVSTNYPLSVIVFQVTGSVAAGQQVNVFGTYTAAAEL